MTVRVKTLPLIVLCTMLLVPAASSGANKKKTPNKTTAKKPNKDTPQKKPKKDPPPKMTPQLAKAITLVKAKYIEVYGTQLESRDWFVRSLAAAALGKLDHPDCTRLLLDRLENERNDLARMIIWEVLHARNPSLTPKQRTRWTDAGALLAAKGMLRGELGAGFIRAMTPCGTTGLDGRAVALYQSYFDACNPDAEQDSRTLTALRNATARWKDRGIVSRLIAALSAPATRRKAAYLLGGLDKSIAPPAGTTGWNEYRQQWLSWLKTADLNKPGDTPDIPPYTGKSGFMAVPEKLRDPRKEKWRKHLELGNAIVGDFDLAIVIDDTGSMRPPMQWVAKNLIKMMDIYRMVSREPRAGIVYFRHEIHPQLKQPCCKRFKRDAPGGGLYAVKFLQLTPDIGKAAANLAAEQPRTGNYLHPQGGPIHAGLYTAWKKLNWSKAKGARKALIVVGDSPITKPVHTLATKMSCDLAEKMKEEGFTTHVLRIRGKLPGYASIAKAGGGTSIHVPQHKIEWRDPKKKGNRNKKKKKMIENLIVAPPRGRPLFNTIVRGVIKTMVAEDYHHLVNPAVDIMLEYVSGKAAAASRKRPR